MQFYLFSVNGLGLTYCIAHPEKKGKETTSDKILSNRYPKKLQKWKDDGGEERKRISRKGTCGCHQMGGSLFKGAPRIKPRDNIIQHGKYSVIRFSFQNAVITSFIEL